MSTDTSLSLAKIQDVINALLGPGGCPWDQKQTPQSLCDYVVEEAFELVSAIRAGDVAETAEELGDVLFLLQFIATLHAQKGEFTLAEAVETNAAKMIRRHPHVFGDTVLKDQEELLRNWERIKRGEKKPDEDGKPAGIFDSLPQGLPPLLKAYRLHAKSARVGFTWETDQDARAQFDAEWREWEAAAAEADDSEGKQERMEEEFGDALFTLVELGRRQGLKANAALDRANVKFLARFRRMEELALARGLDLPELPLDEKNRLWDEAKALLKAEKA